MEELEGTVGLEGEGEFCGSEEERVWESQTVLGKSRCGLCVYNILGNLRILFSRVANKCEFGRS